MVFSVVKPLDVCFAVFNLAQFESNPGKTHWCAVKHILCFLKGTETLSLCITARSNSNFLVFRIPIGPPTSMIASQFRVLLQTKSFW